MAALIQIVDQPSSYTNCSQDAQINEQQRCEERGTVNEVLEEA